jgi:HK97 family phage prohead protease
MPWHVTKSDSCPAARPWAVIKDSDGEVEGCHPSKTAATKQMAALYASEGTMNMTQLTDNLVRSYVAPDAVRASDDGEGRTLHGYFSVFNRWTEVDSAHEGHFLEQVAPGAFDRTLVDNASRIKVLYDHGFDPQLGKKPLGQWTSERDGHGQGYEVALSDAAFNDDFIIPTARAGLLGSSFRFRVPDGGDAVERPMRATKWNPERLKERTLTDVDLYEFGPVSFPQYVEATAGVRCATDDFLDRLIHDPVAFARFAARLGETNLDALLEALPDLVRGAETPDPQPPAPVTNTARSDVPASGPTPTPMTKGQREQRARQIRLERAGRKLQ